MSSEVASEEDNELQFHKNPSDDSKEMGDFSDNEAEWNLLFIIYDTVNTCGKYHPAYYLTRIFMERIFCMGCPNHPWCPIS